MMCLPPAFISGLLPPGMSNNVKITFKAVVVSVAKALEQLGNK